MRRKNLQDETPKGLLGIESLLEKEKYEDAFRQVEEFLQRENLSSNEQLTAKLLRSRVIAKLGKPDEAYKLIEKLWNKVSKQNNIFLIMDYLIIKAQSSWISGRLDIGLEAIGQAKKVLEISESDFTKEMKKLYMQRRSELLQQFGVIYWYRGNLEKSLDCHQESLNLVEKLGDKSAIAASLNNLGLVYFSKSDFRKAIDYYTQSLAIHEELGKKLKVARVLNNLSNIYSQLGDLDQALDFLKQSHIIKKEYGSKGDIIISSINLGVIYQFKGDLDRSLEYSQEALILSEELGYKQHIALALNNIGNIHSLKGELDKAFKFYSRSFDLYKELDIKEKIALSYLNLGDYQKKKGNLDKAMENFQQSLELYNELGNDYSSSLVLYDLILLSMDRHDTTLTDLYLQKLQKLNEQSDSRIVDHHYRIAKALTLKANENARDRMKALVIFEEIIKEEIANHSLTVTAMVHLCDLLLKELKTTGDLELFKEIKNQTHKLMEIAEAQNSFSLLVETYRLEGLLALAELDIKKARELLKKALEIAEEKGLEKSAVNIQDELQKLDEQIELWEELGKRNAPLEETLQHVEIEETIKEIQSTEIIINKTLYSFKI